MKYTFSIIVFLFFTSTSTICFGQNADYMLIENNHQWATQISPNKLGLDMCKAGDCGVTLEIKDTLVYLTYKGSQPKIVCLLRKNKDSEILIVNEKTAIFDTQDTLGVYNPAINELYSNKYNEFATLLPYKHINSNNGNITTEKVEPLLAAVFFIYWFIPEKQRLNQPEKHNPR